MTNHPKTHNNLLGVALCGGRSSRMHGIDKGLMTFNGKPMVAYTLDALTDCTHTIINANRHHPRYQTAFQCPIIPDADSQFDGPLAGMLAGLQYAQQHELDWIITAPCDAPFIHRDYVNLMRSACENSTKRILMARTTTFRQPVFSLLHTSLIDELQTFLDKKQKKILLFYQQVGFEHVNFANDRWFININSPEDRQKYHHGSVE